MCSRDAFTVIRDTENSRYPNSTRLGAPGNSRYTHHSRLLEESYSTQHSNKDHVANLNELIQTLNDVKIPGPQLFRLRTEFTNVLGTGGESEIRGIDTVTLKKLRKGDPKDRLKWPVERIAIKQHNPRQIGASRLGSRFLAAKREVLALAPLFDKHPNIVKLLGWGICLDTIEYPSPGSLQVPLLILERAETDLYRFLNELTPETTGRQPSLGYYRMWEPSHYVDAERGNAPFIERPYELLRRVCIDIGNGLEALHEYNFAHGDLKPQNVLMFKTSGGWVAKLCDFGCARGVVGSSDTPSEDVEQPSSAKVKYAGTKGWLPPEIGPQGNSEVENNILQNCDIFVYGLLVWSVFFTSGRSPILERNGAEFRQLRPECILERAYNDVCDLIPEDSESLGITLIDIFEDTLQVDPNERSMTPWVRLNTRFENSGRRVRGLWKSSRKWAKGTSEMSQKHVSKAPSAAISRSSKPKHLKVSPLLPPEQKTAYKNLYWWEKDQQFATSGQQLRSSNHDPATGEAISEDDDFRSLSTFYTPKRQAGVAHFHDTIISILDNSPNEGQFETYCCARFRSRIPLAWWNEYPKTENLVQAALMNSPVVEFSTLAWLCRGEIGSFEVLWLPNTYETWKVILDRNILNESERLERFLLLLQFGACVELDLSVPGRSEASILVQYIRSCRPVTVSTVMKEICRRFEEVENHSQISEPTRRYMRGQMDSAEQGDQTTAYHDFIAENMKDAYIQLEKHGYCPAYRRIFPLVARSRNAITPCSKYKKGRWFNQVESSLIDETQPFLKLPEGWEQIFSRVFKRRGDLCCFRDVITGSITLKEPVKSLLTIRQFPVGYHDPNNPESCYMDTTGFIHPNTSRAAKAIFDTNIGERFPFYDDSWFRMEQYGPLPSDDVLKAIPDPWKIPEVPSFATRLPSFNFVFTGLEKIGSLVMTILTGLFYILSLFILPLVLVAIIFVISALFSVRGPWAFLAWPVGFFIWLLAMGGSCAQMQTPSMRRHRRRRLRAAGYRI